MDLIEAIFEKRTLPESVGEYNEYLKVRGLIENDIRINDYKLNFHAYENWNRNDLSSYLQEWAFFWN